MKRTLVRYKIQSDEAQENVRLIEGVFRELKAKSPDGLRYLSLRLDDDTFVHLHAVDDGAQPVSALDAFKAFQSNIEDRCVEQPQANEAVIVGNYRMLDEDAKLVGRSK